MFHDDLMIAVLREATPGVTTVLRNAVAAGEIDPHCHLLHSPGGVDPKGLVYPAAMSAG